MSHGESVADGDGVEFEGCCACCLDALAGGLGELLEVCVSWDECGVAVGYADEGFVDVLVC